MRLEAVELRVVELPLVSPFRTSFGTEVVKECIVVRAVTDAGEGWGECVAMTDPFYSSEFLTGAAEVLRRWLVPAAFAAGDGLTADSVGPLTAAVKDHRMAKAALEMAVLDAELRAAGVSLAARLGATETWVPSGVSVGIQPSIAALVEVVDGYLAEPRMLPYQDEWQRLPADDQRARVRFVCDHVASMTDTYAYHVHAEMYGTSAGSGWE